MDFQIFGSIREIESIAIGRSIRQIARLRRHYGGKRWRKSKGLGRVQFADGSIRWAELRWYESRGIGRREVKSKRFVDGR